MRTAERLARACAFLCVLGGAARAHASPLLDLTGGIAGMGGLSARASRCGAAASYFNPALLGDEPMGITAGVVVLGSRIAVDLDPRPAGADVAGGLQNAFHADGARWDAYPASTEALQNGVPADGVRSALPARARQARGSGERTNTYEAVGVVLRMLRDHVALGFYGLIPNSNFTRLTSHYADEREQYFSNSLHPEMYGDRMQSLAMALALAWRIDDRWSIGVGSSISLVANALAPTYVEDASKLQNLSLNLDARVDVGLSPHGGISYRPIPRLRLTATLHAPQQVEFNVRFKYLLGSGLEQASSLHFVLDYMPWQVGAGVAFDAIDSRVHVLTLTASALYARWSQYLDRHGERPVAEFGFDDTITGVLGARYQRGAISLLFDAQYKPTPVPPQVGVTSYVDNDRLGAALGAEYAFSVLDTKISLGAQVLAYALLRRHQTKLSTPTFADGQNRTPTLVRDEVPDDGVLDGEPIAGREGLQTNSPGWPGFASGGLVSGGSLYVKVLL